MLIIIEIAMLIGGVYSIVTARVPGFLVGGGKYQLEGTMARWFGALLVLPLPLAFAAGFLSALLFGEQGVQYAALLEILIVVGVAILAVVLARVAGKQVEPVNDIEAAIAKKSQGALMYAIFSATGFAAPICCPLAFMYASQALKLINEHDIGQQHRRKAITARTIAVVATSLWVLAAVCLVSTMLVGT